MNISGWVLLDYFLFEESSLLGYFYRLFYSTLLKSEHKFHFMCKCETTINKPWTLILEQLNYQNLWPLAMSLHHQTTSLVVIVLCVRPPAEVITNCTFKIKQWGFVVNIKYNIRLMQQNENTKDEGTTEPKAEEECCNDGQVTYVTTVHHNTPETSNKWNWLYLDWCT